MLTSGIPDSNAKYNSRKARRTLAMRIRTSIPRLLQDLAASTYIKELIKNKVVLAKHFPGVEPSVKGLARVCRELTHDEFETACQKVMAVARYLQKDSETQLDMNIVLDPNGRLQHGASWTVGSGCKSTAVCTGMETVAHEAVHVIQRAFPRDPPPTIWIPIKADIVRYLLHEFECVDNPDSSVYQTKQYAFVPREQPSEAWIFLYALKDLTRTKIVLDRDRLPKVSIRRVEMNAKDELFVEGTWTRLDDCREVEAHYIATIVESDPIQAVLVHWSGGGRHGARP
jgi:hypothetical protein